MNVARNTLPVLLCVVGLATSLARSADASDYLLVIDSSGSMQKATPNGQTRIDAAKQALMALKDDLRAHRVGVILFGHTKNPQSKDCCEDIELALPIGPVSDASFDQTIARLKPKGNTPLAESLMRSMYVMQGREPDADKFIVVVTDGNDTCGGDPALQAAAIRNLGINVVTHVVGFGVSKKEATQLQNIAAAGGGQYRSADDVEGLVKAIAVVTGTAPEEEPVVEEEPQKEYSYPELSALEKVLVERLKDESNQVRNQAAQTLQSRKSVAAVPYLIARVQDEDIYWKKDKDIPLAVVVAMAPERVTETLMGTLKAKNPKVRKWATQQLIEHGGPVSGDKLNAVDKALVDLLIKDEDHGVSNEAAKTLQARKVIAAVPYLSQRVQDDRIYWADDKNIPLAALTALAPEKVEEALIGAIQSKNAKVRTWATSKLALPADNK